MATKYTLEYKGKVVATIPAAGYSTPTFTGRAEAVDNELYDQIIKVQQFEAWEEENLPDDVSDDAYFGAMQEQGIERRYYDMWKDRAAWVIRGSDGSTSQAIVSVDEDGVEWRPGDTPKDRSGLWAVAIIFLFIAGLFAYQFMNRN